MPFHSPVFSLHWVLDFRWSREKVALLKRKIVELSPLQSIFHTPVDFSTESEKALISALETKRCDLLMIPVEAMRHWKKIDGFFGVNRLSGPTWWAYALDPLLEDGLALLSVPHRKTFLDVGALSSAELKLILQAMVNDRTRSGLRSFFDSKTPIYEQIWSSFEEIGEHLNRLQNLPEWTQYGWRARLPAFRIVFTSLWSLLFEEGPSKSLIQQINQSFAGNFELAASEDVVGMKVLFPLPQSSLLKVHEQFHTEQVPATHPFRLLKSHADFVRVHIFIRSPQIEISAFFFQSAPAEKAVHSLRSFWIDQLSESLLENPQNFPKVPILPFYKKETAILKLVPRELASKSEIRSQEKIQELSQRLLAKDQLIRELKSGGVGTAPPLPLPDVESLLDGLQERFFDLSLQIRQLESQMETTDLHSLTPAEINDLKLKALALQNRERAWNEKAMKILLELKSMPKKVAKKS